MTGERTPYSHKNLLHEMRLKPIEMKRLFLLPLLICLVIPAACAQIFYKVTPANGGKPSYLFGTHHLANPKKLLEEIPEFDEYFDSATGVVGEIDMTPGMMALSMTAGKYMKAPEDSTLSKIFTPEEYARVDSLLTAVMNKSNSPIRFNMKLMDRMKPVVLLQQCAGVLTAEFFDGFNILEQIDAYFQNQAKAQGKDVIALETADYQYELIFNEPIATQAKMLMEFVENPEAAVIETCELARAYTERDAEAMMKLTEDSRTSGNLDVLLYRRNAEWLAQLPALLNERPLFVAVGALHLYGPEGLVEGLRKAGFAVTPIY